MCDLSILPLVQLEMFDLAHVGAHGPRQEVFYVYFLPADSSTHSTYMQLYLYNRKGRWNRG
jgi:hypothetical protein